MHRKLAARRAQELPGGPGPKKSSDILDLSRNNKKTCRRKPKPRRPQYYCSRIWLCHEVFTCVTTAKPFQFFLFFSFLVLFFSFLYIFSFLFLSFSFFSFLFASLFFLCLVSREFFFVSFARKAQEAPAAPRRAQDALEAGCQESPGAAPRAWAKKVLRHFGFVTK